jgi:hypothetical protein
MTVHGRPHGEGVVIEAGMKTTNGILTMKKLLIFMAPRGC